MRPPLIVCRLSTAVLFLLLVACKPGGGGSGSDSLDDIVDEASLAEVEEPTPGPPVEEPPTAASALEGTWDWCNSGESTGFRATYVFKGQTYSFHGAPFLNPDCSGEPQAGSLNPHSGTFELLEESEDENGVVVRAINLHVEEQFEKPTPSADQLILYNSVSGPTDNTLYFGGIGGETPEERQSVELDATFRRRQ